MSHRLVVTNGTAAVEALKTAGITADFCPWNDVLHDGPVPGNLEDSALSRVRARFIADRGWGEIDEIESWFVERDARLEAAPNFPEVVLWFEHDLYDQLQLIQVLARLSDGRSNVSLVQEEHFVGKASQEQLRADFKARKPVSPAQFGAASMAWAAFRSTAPTSVEAFLSSGRAKPLPFLSDAFRRWAATFPDPERGLSRTEFRTLQLVESGKTDPVDLFAATSSEERAAFRGDASFWLLLDGLTAARRPALKTVSGEPFDIGTVGEVSLELTEYGRGILGGELDWIELNGIDAWRGGVHLTTAHHWRWSERDGFELRETA